MIRRGTYLNRPKGSRLGEDAPLDLMLIAGSRAQRRSALRQIKRQALAGNEEARVFLMRYAGAI